MSNSDVLRIDAALAARLAALAVSTAPAECCGALLGNSDFTGSWEVEQIIELTNRSEQAATQYLITSDDVRFAQRKARALGLDVVGFFHSHPNGSVAPSETDLERAWPGYLYLIVTHDQLAAYTLDEMRGTFRVVGPAS